MKALFNKTIFFPGFILCSFGFLLRQNSPVKGSVDPINSAISAALFSTTDTFTTQIGVDGRFYFEGVKAGQYKLMIEARPPYRNAVKLGIYVANGQPTDVGVIEVTQ